jgi:protein-tyrosine-phosphatase
MRCTPASRTSSPPARESSPTTDSSVSHTCLWAPPSTSKDAELGIDTSDAIPRAVTAGDLAAADVVIAMKPGLDPSGPSRGKYIEWEFPDPAGWNADGIRPLRDAVAQRLESLIAQD